MKRTFSLGVLLILPGLVQAQQKKCVKINPGAAGTNISTIVIRMKVPVGGPGMPKPNMPTVPTAPPATPLTFANPLPVPQMPVNPLGPRPNVVVQHPLAYYPQMMTPRTNPLMMQTPLYQPPQWNNPITQAMPVYNPLATPQAVPTSFVVNPVRKESSAASNPDAYLQRSTDEKDKLARAAFERGQKAEEDGNQVLARACYENASTIYPDTTSAKQAQAALNRIRGK